MTLIDLSRKAALVTGGSRGVGAATAILLAEAGASVAITYRERKSAAEDVLARIDGVHRSPLSPLPSPLSPQGCGMWEEGGSAAPLPHSSSRNCRGVRMRTRRKTRPESVGPNSAKCRRLPVTR